MRLPEAPDVEFEYLTGAVSVFFDDTIEAEVFNHASAKATARVHVYRNTEDGAVSLKDSGRVSVKPSRSWALDYTVAAPGEYWLRILASSEFLVPTGMFQRLRNSVWVPIANYLPGDFAVFQVKPIRRRIR